ncbi:hypothetical protein HAX54_004724 [Datura stramonium]|uniref:S-locus receptor kinase C-terminal domain-containing protein n=1 Tax=Datura stramonium TaxID=4076 RepID=A0ABS8T7E7_DATST|nr:hypothetical protein [Datura stramonium]
MWIITPGASWSITHGNHKWPKECVLHKWRICGGPSELSTNLIDPLLRGSTEPVPDILRCIHIALLCVQENVTDAPIMDAVVLMFSSLCLSLPVPSGPAYSMHTDVIPEISLIQECQNQVN